MKPSKHFVEVGMEEDPSLLEADAININGEVVVFREIADKYYGWRTTATGGLHIDPGLDEDEIGNKKRRLRAEKEKANVFRLLQVSIYYFACENISKCSLIIACLLLPLLPYEFQNARYLVTYCR